MDGRIEMKEILSHGGNGGRGRKAGKLEERIPRCNSVGDRREAEIIARRRAAIAGCAVNTKDSRSPAPSLGPPSPARQRQKYTYSKYTNNRKANPARTDGSKKKKTPANASPIKKELRNNPPIIESLLTSLWGQRVICMQHSCASTGGAIRGRTSG